MEQPLFRDRQHAGGRLADALEHWRGHQGVVVLGLPRGGVPVAAEVAHRLEAPLDVLIVRKLGVPGHEELAMGAVGPGGVVVRNEDVVRSFGIYEGDVERVIHAECSEIARRELAYRGAQRPPVPVEGQVAVLVDDGLATGASMRAAVMSVRMLGPRSIIVAVPVGAPETCEELRLLADEVVCPHTPRQLRSVGWWYEDFNQTTDEEVREALSKQG